MLKKNATFKLSAAAILIVLILATAVWSANNLIPNFGVSRNDNKVTQSKQSAVQIQRQAEQTTAFQEQSVQTNDYEIIAQQARQLAESKNLSGLASLGDTITVSYAGRDIGLYTELMIVICGALSSYNFDNDQQYVLSRQCTKNALKKLDEMPIGRAFQLVSLLGGDNEYISGVVPESSWAGDRTERLQYWCRAWQRLESEIDANFNFEANRPNYHPRMTAEEKRKAEKYNQQRFLQRDKKNYQPDFERFLVDAYIKPPYSTSELEVYLQKYVKDSRLRESILNQVRQKISDAQKEN